MSDVPRIGTAPRDRLRHPDRLGRGGGWRTRGDNDTPRPVFAAANRTTRRVRKGRPTWQDFLPDRKNPRREVMTLENGGGEPLAAQFLDHRSVTRDLAARIPEELSGFRPWDGARSTVELVNHIAVSHHTLLGIALGRGVQRPDPATLPQDLPSARRLLDELTDTDAGLLREITRAQLTAAREGIHGRAHPGEFWVRFGREHEAHHKGQLFTYCRMNGTEPPSPWVRF